MDTSGPMKKETEILLSAAFCLTPEENWTKGRAARDESGKPVDTADPTACRFCAAGAIVAASNDLGYSWINEQRSMRMLGNIISSHSWRMYRRRGAATLGTWNDTHTHAKVLEALYRAAELAESK